MKPVATGVLHGVGMCRTVVFIHTRVDGHQIE